MLIIKEAACEGANARIFQIEVNKGITMSSLPA